MTEVLEESEEEEKESPIPVTALPQITVVLESAKPMVYGKIMMMAMAMTGDDNDFDDDIDVGDGVQLYRILWYYDDKAVPDNDDDDGGVDDANYGDDDDDDDDDIGNDDNLEKCLKEPELASREDPKKEDDLDNLSKEENLDNISERENVENESRSVKLGAFNENPAPALPQQQPSIDQNVQVINT